jgi:hypothetical protein
MTTREGEVRNQRSEVGEKEVDSYPNMGYVTEMQLAGI